MARRSSRHTLSILALGALALLLVTARATQLSAGELSTLLARGHAVTWVR